MVKTKFIRFILNNRISLGICACVFVIAALFSAYFYVLTANRLQTLAETRMQSVVDSFVLTTSEHALGGVQALQSARAFFVGSDTVTRSEFYAYVQSSHFLDAYPGFQTMGYAPVVHDEDKKSFIKGVVNDITVKPEGYPDYHISPAGTRNVYLPIQYIYPEDQVSVLLGLDSYGDPVRKENADRARDINDVSVSGVLQLGEGGDGVVVALPLYDKRGTLASPEQRRENFQGLLTTAIDLHKFFDNILTASPITQRGVGVSMTGRTGRQIIITEREAPRDFLSKMYGDIQMKKSMPVTQSTQYVFTFTAPVSNFLSIDEKSEPFLYVFIVILAAFVLSLVIVILQRQMKMMDLKNRYDFVSTLSHQLRTPVTRLRWAMESSSPIVKRKREFGQVMNDIFALQVIIERLLKYIELPNVSKIKLEKISVESFYEQIIAHISPKDIKRIVRTGSKVKGFIRVDNGSLSSAISYIVENALVYSPKKSKVIIQMRKAGSLLEIKISDSGYGIPVKEQAGIFNEFFRATNASLGKNEGSGVSLFIAKNSIESNGGTVGFTSKEGIGTEFIIRLPLV